MKGSKRNTKLSKASEVKQHEKNNERAILGGLLLQSQLLSID